MFSSCMSVCCCGTTADTKINVSERVLQRIKEKKGGQKVPILQSLDHDDSHQWLTFKDFNYLSTGGATVDMENFIIEDMKVDFEVELNTTKTKLLAFVKERIAVMKAEKEATKLNTSKVSSLRSEEPSKAQLLAEKAKDKTRQLFKKLRRKDKSVTDMDTNAGTLVDSSYASNLDSSFMDDVRCEQLNLRDVELVERTDTTETETEVLVPEHDDKSRWRSLKQRAAEKLRNAGSAISLEFHSTQERDTDAILKDIEDTEDTEDQKTQKMIHKKATGFLVIDVVKELSISPKIQVIAKDLHVKTDTFWLTKILRNQKVNSKLQEKIGEVISMKLEGLLHQRINESRCVRCVRTCGCRKDDSI
eukprot:GEMP01052504.1.p1 GENE.GEMP01052504.1~~GEMP01052504.1.p1  ORF type:complete len:361 (+),score=75.32 GEMP01052504.1:119-1201(+)